MNLVEELTAQVSALKESQQLTLLYLLIGSNPEDVERELYKMEGGRDSDTQPDPYIDRMAAEHAEEYSTGNTSGDVAPVDNKWMEQFR